MLLLISLAPLISCELQEWRQRGCHCPGMWTCNLFNFTPALQSPSAWTIARPGQRCHLLFISSTIREEKKVLYIVMLPHLSDISKIEVQAKDQYKLKVNTKKKKEKKRRQRGADTLPCLEIHFLFLRLLSAIKLLFVQDGEERIWRNWHRYILRVITLKVNLKFQPHICSSWCHQ